jgi:histone H3/H4
MRSFKKYIHIILKDTTSAMARKRTISKHGKSYLDYIMQTLLSTIITTSIHLLQTSKTKTTLTVKDLVNTIRLLFPDEMMRVVLQLCHDCTHQRCRTIIPPSLIHTFIKEHKFEGMKIGSGCRYYITYLLEYICSELVQLAYAQTELSHRSRITCLDIKNAVLLDKEFNILFARNSLYISTIEPVILSKTSFSKLAQIVMTDLDHSETKISEKARQLLQYHIESRIVKEILQKADKVRLYTKRQKLNEYDILFAYNNM